MKITDEMVEATDAFTSEDYRELALRMRERADRADLKAIMSNNFNVILGALDVAQQVPELERVLSVVDARLVLFARMHGNHDMVVALREIIRKVITTGYPT